MLGDPQILAASTFDSNTALTAARSPSSSATVLCRSASAQPTDSASCDKLGGSASASGAAAALACRSAGASAMRLIWSEIWPMVACAAWSTPWSPPRPLILGSGWYA
eukprot:SAG25_NODE_384_length_8785_cov_7.011628_12_plen_107_part_00